MTQKASIVDMERFIDGLHEYMQKNIYKPLGRRIAALEAQSKAVSVGDHRNVAKHEVGRLYEAGSMVMADGTLWRAKRRTQQSPGEGDGWAAARWSE